MTHPSFQTTKIPMERLHFCIAVLSLALVTGCGSGTPADEGQPSGDGAATGDSASVVPSPTDIVSLFLDEVRRGGQDSRAQSLLTKRAQNELSRIGHTVQPIGSPDARFEVTRAEAVPGEPNAALVHSLWREPAGDGALQDFQVVWAVEKEAAGWRISGLAIEVSPNQPPQIVDFEDGNQMAKLLTNEQETTAEAAPPAQNTASPAISR
jgi:hypothetical protein